MKMAVVITVIVSSTEVLSMKLSYEPKANVAYLVSSKRGAPSRP